MLGKWMEVQDLQFLRFGGVYTMKHTPVAFFGGRIGFKYVQKKQAWFNT